MVVHVLMSDLWVGLQRLLSLTEFPLERVETSSDRGDDCA